MQLIERDYYISKLETWRDKQMVKILTGIRRSGKSTIMILYQQHLIRNGINQNQILHLNFEDLSVEPLLDYHKLYEYVTQHLQPEVQNYLFFDEIQAVAQFERVIDSLLLLPNVDIYITGSNAFLLSGEIATLLSGRYIEIQVLPFSLSEYQRGMNLPLNQLYNQYITTTSLPYTLQLTTSEAVSDYLQNIYQTIVIKDILSRGKIQDPDLLNRILRYLSGNIGNLSSIKSITDTLTSNGRKVSTHTVDNYVDLLCASFMFYKVFRYDVKGKEYLRTGAKYYICDIGLRNWLLGLRGGDLGHILENVVFLHLLRQGKHVMVGKVGSKEVDFVCFQNGKTEYYQVALSVRDENVLNRELAPLNAIKDNYPKYLITLDPDPEISHNGIVQRYALDWLLDI